MSPGTSFWVTPVIALVTPGFELRPNADEVQDVFEVPLVFFDEPGQPPAPCLRVARVSAAMVFHAVRRVPNAPNGEVQTVEHFIWGATAGMLRNFYRFLAANPST
jgi:hypothetical protein